MPTNFGPPQLVLSAFGSAAGWSSQNLNPRLLGDINNDGNADIVGFGNDGVTVSLANGTGGFMAPMFASGTMFWGTQTGGWMSQDAFPRLLAGAVGTHVAEIVGFASNGVYVSVADAMGGFLPPMLAMGTSFWGAQTGGWTSQDLYPRALADVNNDLIADIVGFASNGVYVSRGDVIGFFAPEFAGAAFWGVQTGNWSSQDTYSRFMADADGDGKPDIVGFAQSGVYVSINTSTLISSSFAAPRFVPDSSFWGVQTGGWSSQNLYPHLMADVNADGKADIVGFAQSGVYVSINTSSLISVSFAAPALVPGSSFWGANTGGWSSQDAYPRELANIANGDTMADIVGFAQNGVWTSLAGATTFFAPSGSATVSMLDQGTSSGVTVSSPDVALLSQYMAGSFATSSGGNGTLSPATDAALTTQPAWLAPPHP
jgi:hypothetical protein